MTGLIVLVCGAALGVVVTALLAAEVLLRLLPRLELHGLRSALGVVRHEVLRRHRPDAPALRRRITRAVARQRVVMPTGRTYAAQSVVVWVAAADLELLGAVAPIELLEDELAAHYRDVAQRQRWVGTGTVSVALHARPDLPSGSIDVEVRIGRPEEEAPEPRSMPPADLVEATVPYGAAPDGVTTERFARDSCSATLTYRQRTITLFADEAPALLGRSSGATLHLLEEGVSREHAMLDHRDGVWTLRPNADARNGTYIEGVRITGPRSLRGRRIIRFGQQCAAEFSSDCRHVSRVPSTA